MNYRLAADSMIESGLTTKEIRKDARDLLTNWMLAIGVERNQPTKDRMKLLGDMLR